MGKNQHGLKAAVGPKPAKALGRSSKQLFLDLGQRDFSASKCEICGMVYAKGHEEDEKLHKTFHSSAVQGLKFQGWPQERLVLLEPLAGRLLMLLPNDPPAHMKKVQEVCSFIEKSHGLSSGWLMAAPQYQVFLYVSLQKRVVGLAVVEPIKHAYKLAAAGPVDQEADSCQLVAGKQQNSRQQQRHLPLPESGAAAAADAGPVHSSMDTDKPPQTGDGAMGPPQQQQQRSLLWAELMQVGSAAAAAAAAAAAQPEQQQQPEGVQRQHAASGPAAAGSKPPGASGGSSEAGGSGIGGGSSAPSSGIRGRGQQQLGWQEWRRYSCWQWWQQGRSGGAAAAAGAGACMVADKRRAVRAMLGVRMVWVSSEQRRKGMATKLLDAARCNMVPGYVVPRSQLAFTQPTVEGARLAAAFADTQQIMVYGIE
ncbi:ESCO1/2 acetyl-transferase-domain-containing protein [Scenedesmus sp. NREL 46B-D3]|nr:ESCO1/2 acetyl-transferase-domain-containing protein [Scenedesmus sp. NREL 46B-D3]